MLVVVVVPPGIVVSGIALHAPNEQGALAGPVGQPEVAVKARVADDPAERGPLAGELGEPRCLASGGLICVDPARIVRVDHRPLLR